MGVKDCPPRAGHPVTDPESLVRWLDMLQRRQNIDDQIELTSLASGDEFWVFDVSETGEIKLKKITASNVLNTTLQGAWASWAPTRTGWTDVGTPTVTARYCRVGNLIFFQIKVVPETSVATVAGTSYVSLPVAAGASGIAGDASMMDTTALTAIGGCVFDISNSRCYVPAQIATGDTLTIAGFYEG